MLHILIKNNKELETLTSFSQCDVSTIVSGIKVSTTDEKTYNESFNMFGELVKIILNILSLEKLIRKAKAFGITGAAHDHQLAQQLVLELDMDLNIYLFKRCIKSIHHRTVKQNYK